MFFTLRSRRRRTEVNRVTSCYSTGSQTSHRCCPLANKVENTSMGIPKYDSQHSLQRSLEPIEVCLPPKKLHLDRISHSMLYRIRMHWIDAACSAIQSTDVARSVVVCVSACVFYLAQQPKRERGTRARAPARAASVWSTLTVERRRGDVLKCDH